MFLSHTFFYLTVSLLILGLYSTNSSHSNHSQAPYAPKIKDALDTSNFDPYPEDAYIPPYTGSQDIFEGF